MNFNGCWSVVILFSLIFVVLPRACGVQVQIERPKELVRHQQKHRPPFIERRLVQDTKFEEISSGVNEERLTLGEFEKKMNEELESDDEDTLDTGLEISLAAAQIRHGRSRGHNFARQIKTEDPEEVQFVGFKGKRKSGLMSNRNVSYLGEETVTESSEGNTTEVMNVTNELADEKTNITKMNLQEQAVHKLGKILNEMHSNIDLSSIKKTAMKTRVSSSSLGNLRKAFPPEKKLNQYSSNGGENSTEDFGTLVHTSKEERRLNENFGKVKLEDQEACDEVNDSRNSSEWSEKSMAEYEGESPETATKRSEKQSVQVDIVTRFLRIIENQHLLGKNCTAGTDLNLGEGVVDRYAQERFRLEANLAVNRANMLTRLWKYAPEVMLSSEYLLHAGVLSMVEFDEDIFAAGNCYDKLQYRDHWLYCPFAHRLEDQDAVLVKDLAVEYKYLTNSSEWFYIARKNAERVIASNNQFSHGKYLPLLKFSPTSKHVTLLFFLIVDFHFLLCILLINQFLIIWVSEFVRLRRLFQ